VDERFSQTHPNQPRFQWEEVGTVIVTNLQLVEKPATRKSRRKDARARGQAERLAELRRAKPAGLFGECGVRTLAKWLLEKLCQPACLLAEVRQQAELYGISDRTLRREYKNAGVRFYGDRYASWLVKAATPAEAEKVMSGLPPFTS